MIWIALNYKDWVEYVAIIFSSISALATAYAALSASRSARVAESSASSWKKQKIIDVELQEAKDLKISLNAWHRHVLRESERYGTSLLVVIMHDARKNMQNPEVVLSQIKHLQSFIDRYESLWNQLESSFDSAGFIENDFEQRLRLRRNSILYLNNCKSLLSYYKSKEDFIKFPINEVCSAIYHVPDWDSLFFNGGKVTKIKLEHYDDQGCLNYVIDDDGAFVYESLPSALNSWVMQIGSTIDNQINMTKLKLKNI